jgi:hypothetical protein
MSGNSGIASYGISHPSAFDIRACASERVTGARNTATHI